MSQSRFSIVLVGVWALLRRPLVSRLRPAGFTARGSGGFRRSGRPSVSAFAAGRVDLRTHRFCFSARTASEIAAGRVGLRAHCFRFSARTASGLPSAGWFFCLPFRRLPLGGLAFGLTTSAFRHAPLRSCPRRVGLRAHGFRFSACAASGLPLGELGFGLTASAFRHAPLRGCCSAGWPSGSRLPLFGTHRFGVALGELAFGLTASAFRHAPLRGCRSVGWPSGFCFGDCRSAGWASGSRLPLFGTHRSAPPRRRSEGRRSTPTRHLFHFKTLISTC